MNRRLLTIVLILILLVSWVVIIDLARDLRDARNALKIAEDFLDESRDEIRELSTVVDNYNEEGNRGITWNEEAIPEHRR